MKRFYVGLFVFLFAFLFCSCETEENEDESDNGNTDDADDNGNTNDADDIDVPTPRVVINLTWKQGFKSLVEAETVDGTKIDLDLHFIKKTSLEAPEYGYTPLEGVMGTLALDIANNDSLDAEIYEKYFRHDDCSPSDKGKYVITSVSGPVFPKMETIKWNAALDLDNTWGGNDYGSPEAIGLGSTVDGDHDGIPDKPVIDDQYLVVVSYANCTSQYEDGIDRCDENYSGKDGAYEVDARVQIFVDGEEVPRPAKGDRPADNYSGTTKDLKIKVNEWKVVTVIKWDNSLPSPETNLKYPGDAIVSDIEMTDEGIVIDASAYKTCNFSFTDAILVPIWDETAYYDFVNAKRDPEDENSPTIGECY